MAEAVKGSMDWIRQRAGRKLHPEHRDAFVREVFPNTLIVEDFESGELFEYSWKISGNDVEISNKKKVELTYVATKRKKAQEADEDDLDLMHDLTGPIVTKNEAKKLITTVVLVPGETDGEDGPITADKVEDVANEYMANWRHMDLEHSFALKGDNEPSAIPVQSWTTDYPEEVTALDGTKMELPHGTWKLRSRVRDDLWQDVVNGDIAGASIMGVSREEFEELRAATKSEAEFEEEVSRRVQRVPLSELGDWFCPVVSLCKKGQVPKAKIIAMKSSNEEEGEKPKKPTFWQRVFGMGHEAEHEPEAVTVKSEEPEVETTQEEDGSMAMTPEDRQELAEVMGETFANALKSAGLMKEDDVETEEDRRRREAREAARSMLEEAGFEFTDEGKVALKTEEGAAEEDNGSEGEAGESEGEEEEPSGDLDESEREELERLREQDENLKELFSGDLDAAALKQIFPEFDEGEEEAAEATPKVATKAKKGEGKSRAQDLAVAASASDVATKSEKRPDRDSSGRRINKPFARVDK